MKKFYLLIILLVSVFSYAQIEKYDITISNLSYRINKGVKNTSDNSKIRITIFFESGPPKDIYLRQITEEGDNENGLNIPVFTSYVKPISLECYAKVNFRTGDDADGTVSKSLNVICPSGNFDDSYSARMDNIKFNYKVEPVFSVNQPSPGNILPTHLKKTITSTPGYDLQYYRWQYTLLPNGTSTIWTDLPQYNTEPNITVDAVDILKENTYLNIGKNINFRIKPCTATPGLSGIAVYSIRLSAPQVLSSAAIQPTCSDSEDGSIKLGFSRALLNGEQLRYTLLDVGSGTPIDYNGDLLIDASKNFNITGLRAGTYTLQLIGFKDGLNTDVAPSQDPDLFDLTTFTIASPPPVDFTLSSTDVQCNGSQDGTITITASGGTGKGYQYSIDNGSWMPFLNPNSNTHTILDISLPSGLLSTAYTIRMKDANECVAKIQNLVEGKIELGEEKKLPITLSQPATLVTLDNSSPFLQQPTFKGAVNGNITVSFTGGTPIAGNSYSFQWANENYTKEELKSKTTTQYSNGIYAIKLNNVPAGNYNLTVQDKNGCTLDIVSEPKLAIILGEPEPIEIILTQTQAISCNSASLDPLANVNKAANGILTATVKGGIQFTGSANDGLPYIYNWSKYDLVLKSWIDLVDIKTDKALNLSEGEYALNVEDANGIVQGTYSTTALIAKIPTKQPIAEPLKLVLSFEPGNVSCFQGNNGWLTANVVGGAGDYKYTWYNTGKGVIDNNKVTGLTAGTYSVEVKDTNGCLVSGKWEIDEPESAVTINYKEVNPPTFSGATNGKIVVEVSGGTPYEDLSYNYEWKNKSGAIQTTTALLQNGIYTIILDGVPADDYFLTVKDENYDTLKNQIINCSVLESNMALTEPDPLQVVFEISNTISCNSGNEFGNNTDVAPNDGQRDESQDGILIAHVAGGIPLAAATNNGLPYYFYWKKQLTDGSWIALPDIKGETASDLSHGNYALNVKDRNGIVLGTYVNNQLTQEIDVTQFMQEPPKLSITITKGDVFCNGGNDGWATANVVGGTPPYNYNWSNGVSVFENTILKAGKYVINITDAKGCATQNEVTIIEPINPIIVKVEKTINPSFYQATNGEITVTVKGGTLFPNNSYLYEWKNSKGIVQKTTTTTFLDGVYTITLNDLPEETYNLTISDANYSVATSKIGCTVLNTMVSLEDPDPLEVTFEVVRKISCNVSNEFGNEIDANPLDSQRDETQDGIAVAHVKGGIPLQANQNNGLGYFYTWKKQQKDGSWTIWNDKDETAEYLSDGTYALNIEDANGIKLGTYVNNQLTKEIDVIQLMPQPAKLSLTFNKLDVGCTTGDDGWAEAHVSGGTPPYTYEWTNGETTAKIQNITTNNYFVIATDAKGCVVQGSIFVGDPNGIFTTETIKKPTCFKGNDASIQLNVTGGNVPYSYLWSTGATTKDLNNLTAGTYEVAIMCPDCCVYKKKFVTADPEPIIVAIGPDRTLCNDQNLDLDATIGDPKAQYSWTSTNGFTSNEAKVTLSKAGTYRVKVTSGLGCFGEDEIVIKTSQTAISSEFLLSSQAYLDEEVILINTSNPFGEGTNWIIPKGVKVVEQKEKYITLKFDAVGVYTIGLQQTQGECYATYSKNITVEQRGTLPNNGTSSQFIVGFVVTPNPNDGNFKAVVTLENSSAINLRLFSASGQFTSIQKKESAKKKYEVDFNTSLAAGMYILVLETEQQTLVKKIIIY